MVQRSIQLGRLVRRGALAPLFAGLIVLSWSPAPATAQPEEGAGATAPVDSRAEIDDAVAEALFDRGQLLFARGDFHNAKKLFVEALERSPRGPWADKSMAMLRSTNERLGIRNLEHGAPRIEKIPTAEEPVDPYASAGHGEGGGDGPVDPYAPDATGGGDAGSAGLTGDAGDLVDPYGSGRASGPASGAGGSAGGPVDAGPPSARTMRNRALFSGAAWGGFAGALFGDLVTGIDSSSNGEIAGFLLGGALVGTGAGYLYAQKAQPTEDELALVNSMGLYGAAAGLLIAVGLDPEQSEAYSLQGLVGSVVGLGAGFYLAGKWDISRRRTWRLDLGALAGVAATWALFYPLVSDDSTHNDEMAAGWVSVAAMGGGAAIAYLLTRNMDRRPARESSDEPKPPPVAGLITRTENGHWTAGSPLVRPMLSPALTGRGRSTAWGLDLLGGRF